MSKEPTGLKYPMVNLFTDVTMSFMYLNMLTASNLLLLSAPWLFTQAWMKGLESGARGGTGAKGAAIGQSSHCPTLITGIC